MSKYLAAAPAATGSAAAASSGAAPPLLVGRRPRSSPALQAGPLHGHPGPADGARRIAGIAPMKTLPEMELESTLTTSLPGCQDSAGRVHDGAADDDNGYGSAGDAGASGGWGDDDDDDEAFVDAQDRGQSDFLSHYNPFASIY
eukprot:229224-Chlamydomonas_euryale.AAC.1